MDGQTRGGASGWRLPALYAGGTLLAGALALGLSTATGSFVLALLALLAASGCVSWLAHRTISARLGALEEVKHALDRSE